MTCRRLVFFGLLVTASCFHDVEAAVRVIHSEFVGDFDIASNATVSLDLAVPNSASVAGIGLIGDWTAVVADQSDGLYPWALDLKATVTSPSGTDLTWEPIGGDVTIADYPLADYSGEFETSQPGGLFSVAFTTPRVPRPYVSGIRGATLYATEHVADIVTEYDGSVTSGPMWNRPFFIEGVSGLGPVVYDVLPFTVSESGGYSFESIIPSGNNFTAIYRDAFDPNAPLENLFDYGLGNGFAPNGTPQGTSLIESLLLEGESYFYVTSQFQRTTPGTSFQTTIVGPGELTGLLLGDFDGDGDYACADVDSLVAAIASQTNSPTFDLNADGVVNGQDLNRWLAEAGMHENVNGAPYLLGDADLNGGVDAADFIIWNQNKFTQHAAWCGGDFNADGSVDASDYILWNQYKFQTATRGVPEPASTWLLGMGIAFLLLRCRTS